MGAFSSKGGSRSRDLCSQDGVIIKYVADNDDLQLEDAISWILESFIDDPSSIYTWITAAGSESGADIFSRLYRLRIQGLLTYGRAHCFTAVDQDSGVVLAACTARPSARSSFSKRKRGKGLMGGLMSDYMEQETVLDSAPADVRARFDSFFQALITFKVDAQAAERCWHISMLRCRDDGDGPQRRLLTHIMELTDRDRAEITASVDGDDRLIALYRDHGFTVQQEVVIPDGPSLYIVHRPFRQ